MANSPWSNQAVTLIILSEQTQGFSGLFGYNPSPGLGNLIFSLAAAAGTDPYGNAYPQGLNSTVGSISGTTFNGTNFVINSSGAFFYSGTPAKGNLILSIANASGTDSVGNNYPQGFASGVWSASTGNQLQSFSTDANGNVLVKNSSSNTVTKINSSDGAVLVYNSSGIGAGNMVASMAPAAGTDSAGNTYPQGFADYVSGGGDIITFAMGIVNGFAGFTASSKNFAPANGNPVINMVPNSSGCHMDLSSGKAGTAAAILNLEDSTFSGITGGLSWLQVGQAQFGNSGILTWDSNNSALYFPGSSTPPTPSGANTAALHASSTTGALFAVNPAGTNRPISQSASGGGGQTANTNGFTTISDQYAIASTEVVAGTTFRLTAWGHGTFGTTTLAQLNMNVQGGSAQSSVPTTAQSSAAGCFWRASAIIRFTGATTANINLELNTSSGGSNGYSAHGNTTGATISFPYNFGMFASWANTTGSPTITCDGTLLERLAN